MKIKLIPLLVILFTIGCSGAKKGVDQEFILEQFEFSSNDNPTIIDLIDEEDGSCPNIEFDSENTTSYQVRLEPGNPSSDQSTFRYADTEFDEFNGVKTLKNSNSSGSTMELSFDGSTYTLEVDYNCELPDQTDDCTNVSYICSGVLQ